MAGWAGDDEEEGKADINKLLVNSCLVISKRQNVTKTGY